MLRADAASGRRVQKCGYWSVPAGAANFDLAWRVGGTAFVAEVNRLTPTNEAMQLRLGLGQVLDCAEMLRRSSEQNVQPGLVTGHEPAETR